MGYYAGITLLNGYANRKGDGTVKGIVRPGRKLCRMGTKGFDESACTLTNGAEGLTRKGHKIRTDPSYQSTIVATLSSFSITGST